MSGAYYKLRVPLGPRSYDIVIESGLLARAGAVLKPVLASPRVIIITDEKVASLHLPALQASLTEAGIHHDTVKLPEGETSKSFSTLETLTEWLLGLRPERTTTLLALGGGVIGDLTGFAASILLRGVEFIQLPTTLLAQVDSSVGGKTGINTAQGKNLIGSFHQPRLVLADIAALATLPARQMRAGYAEIVKYGLINDAGFFTWLHEHAGELLAGEQAPLAHAVHASCMAKAAIVSEDEKETGKRALLNLGHTFAHALEAEAGYGDTLLHGEAVAIGLSMAFFLSARMGHCSMEDYAKVRAHLETCSLPVLPPPIAQGWQPERLIAHMRQDKKVRGGKLTFVLARGIGKAFVAEGLEEAEISAMLAEYLAV